MSATAATGFVSAAAVDYLQRTGADPLAEAAAAPLSSAPPEARRILHVRGLSGLRRTGGSTAAAEKLLTGLAGARTPVAAVVTGTEQGAAFHIGTWTTADEPADRLERRERVLRSVLDGVYSAIDLDASQLRPSAWPLAGLALGVPTVSPPDEADGSNGADRLVAALTGMRFAVVVLAEPLSEEHLSRRSGQVLNELRAVAAWEQSSQAPSPLGRHYSGLLEHALATFGAAQGIGGWRTAVYLMGDEVSYPCLASAWRAIHSGAESLPEPIRVFDAPDVSSFAARWALPEAPAASGPGGYHHDHACQTVLSSHQLAAFVQLPARELPGFSVRVGTAFDVVPAVADGEDGLALGDVLHRSRPTQSKYRITPKSLTRHAFVAGVTGAGKTNTIFHMLAELDERGIPFLAIEPAKREYRELATQPRFAGRLQILTPGDESVAPLRLNPFEVPPGTSVQEHLDLLRAAFGASFGLWAPLPQVLERSMHEIYVDRGWDLRTNTNPRLGGAAAATAAAFPTMSDLAAKVAEVAGALGYEERVASDIRAALVTRIDSLRRGGKGAMLDVARSLPIEQLLDRPTVLELESMGDDDDKAFLMALLLARLGEHRRAQGKSQQLVHVLVIEEAHRLLANVAAGASEYEGNPRGEAVETFTNLLSEVRAYGEGVIVADQVPVRLAPDVIKNTNLKVAHRIVASDDRKVLGGAMVMDPDQIEALATLRPGQAALYSDGDDAPLLVAIPLVKDTGESSPTNADVAAAAAGSVVSGLPSAACAEACAADRRACDWAREVLAARSVQKVLSRVVVSTAVEPGALARTWPELLSVLRPRWPLDVPEELLLAAFAGHAADWWAQRRGAQAGWSYADVEAAAGAVRDGLLAAATGAGVVELAGALQREAARLLTRAFDPFPACTRVCGPSACVYRGGVADLVGSGRYDESFRDAERTDAGDPERRRPATWEVSQDAGYEVVEFAEQDVPAELAPAIHASARRASLCFAQQMVARDVERLPRTGGRAVDRILAQSGHEGTSASPAVATTTEAGSA